jgi:hypothetical protein
MGRLERRRFSRHYYDDLQRDYAEVVRDAVLYGTWSQLLDELDAKWPGIPYVPRYCKPAAVRRLIEIGLVIDLGDHQYGLKGYDEERRERSDQHAEAGRMRAVRAAERSAPADHPLNGRTAGAERSLSNIQATPNHSTPGAVARLRIPILVDPQTQTEEEKAEAYRESLLRRTGAWTA